MVKFSKCDDCGGSGLKLNSHGEPDDCPHCRGAGSVPKKKLIAVLDQTTGKCEFQFKGVE